MSIDPKYRSEFLEELERLNRGIAQMLSVGSAVQV